MVMKKIVLIFILALSGGIMGQSTDNLDFSPFQSQDKGDPVAAENDARRRIMNHQWEEMEQQRRAEMECKVREASARVQQSGGVTIRNDNSTVRSANTATGSDRQQQQAQRDYEHQQWLARQQVAREEATERERERERKEREERERRYNRAYNNAMRNSEGRYNRLHDAADYKANEGFDMMMNTQPAGTERIHSGYIPSKGASSAEITAIVSKHGVDKHKIVGLTGHENSSLNSDWDQAMAKYLATHQIKELPQHKSNNLHEELWQQLYATWDGGQKAYMEYVMKNNNGGTMPFLMGVNNSGQYVFQSDDGNKMFVVSTDGATLMVVEYDKHNISDENIIKKIKEGGIGDNLFEVGDAKVKCGDISILDLNGDRLSWKDLREMEEKELFNLLPQIKKEIKMKLFDNSDKMTGQIFCVTKTETMTPGITTNAVGGEKLEITGGQKSELEAKGTISLTGVEGSIGGSVSVLGVGNDVTAGMIIGMGDKYYLASGRVALGVEFGVGAGVKGGIKVDKEPEMSGELSLPGLKGKIKVGGAMFKCLNCEEEGNEY